MHFDDLFARYGAPLLVLNLIKTRETQVGFSSSTVASCWMLTQFAAA